ncbi:benzoylformate decarboxylase [Streptomyces sp. NPDC054796]
MKTTKPAQTVQPAQTVRQAAFDLLRAHDATLLFGNPGTTELPFLTGLPEDFRYVLGLNEASVTGIADGYAQATGRPAVVNLHTAAGLGNAIGALVNARGARSPLVALVGQQSRGLIGSAGALANTEPVTLPLGAVKHSEEPARADEVPAALARALHIAAQPPAGPVVLSVPMDDWSRPADEEAARVSAGRTVHSRTVPEPAALDALARALTGARAPAMVVGPDAATDEGFEAAGRLAHLLGTPVWIDGWGARCGFPTGHPAFRGVLPMSPQGVAKTLSGHDLVLCAGAPVFRYLSEGPEDAASALPEMPRVLALTSDPAEAARAVAGDAYCGDVGLTLRELCRRVPGPVRALESPVRTPLPTPAPGARFTGQPEVIGTLAGLLPDETVLVHEAAREFPLLWSHLPHRLPGSYYFPGGYGLGFATAGAVGIQLATERPVVALVGDGALQYTVQALWTAAQHRLPVAFAVLDNGEYGVLKDQLSADGTARTPGMDIPSIDVCALARGYGVPARGADTAEELASALAWALENPGPHLVAIRVEEGARAA